MITSTTKMKSSGTSMAVSIIPGWFSCGDGGCVSGQISLSLFLLS